MSVLQVLVLLLSACLAAGDPGNRKLQARAARPTCPAAFLLLPGPPARRLRLPACSLALTAAAIKPAAVKPAAARPAAVAAAAADSNAYPCPVGNATCFCLWKASIGAPLGYWADTDPTVACTCVERLWRGMHRRGDQQLRCGNARASSLRWAHRCKCPLPSLLQKVLLVLRCQRGRSACRLPDWPAVQRES